ncbi:MAG: 2-C-methyl-D-erythritol 4-phosphate cytidylyltransferase [Puniceicoccales bacterium]|jgi:2-C-methyl-D-erythritol 4-phosphate cytidylyltransferase|nr:2-C-methyl-D-erythritol 4-phosphate cytidylyltransferase [Puniceicoccales bacterium]
MNQPENGTAILLMGGAGTRMGGSCPDKTLVPIVGRPVFSYSLLTIDSSKKFSEIVIVTRDSVQRGKIEQYVGNLSMHSNVSYVQGGDSRQKSVLNALLYVRQKQQNFVLIHDAARPLVTRENLWQLISALDGHGGAILAHGATDTLINISNRERQYLQRDSVWHVETPQIFGYEAILDAYLKAKGLLTDDSSALPQCAKVKIVENFHPNIKITHPRDLIVVEALLTKNPAQ